jgi:hypothetical protein
MKKLVIYILFSSTLSAFDPRGPLDSRYCENLKRVPFATLDAHREALVTLEKFLAARFYEQSAGSFSADAERFLHFPRAAFYLFMSGGSLSYSAQFAAIRSASARLGHLDPTNFLEEVEGKVIDPVMNSDPKDLKRYDIWLAFYYRQAQVCLECLDAEIKERRKAS